MNNLPLHNDSKVKLVTGRIILVRNWTPVSTSGSKRAWRKLIWNSRWSWTIKTNPIWISNGLHCNNQPAEELEIQRNIQSISNWIQRHLLINSVNSISNISTGSHSAFGIDRLKTWLRQLQLELLARSKTEVVSSIPFHSLNSVTDEYIFQLITPND